MTNKNISGLTAATLPLAGTELVPAWDGATKKVATNDLSVRNYRANATTGVMQITGPAAAAIRIMTVPDADWTAARADTGQTFTGLNTFTYSAAGYSLSVTNTQGAATGNGLYVQTRWDVAANIVAKFTTNSGATDVLTLYGDGRTVFSTGNLVQATAAKGINFTANTPAAGMTSQLLNWYEEGTWTPSVGGTATYTIQSGTYTRIGRVVHVKGSLQINAIGTGSTSVVSGLPYSADGFNSVLVGYFSNLATNVLWISGYAASGTTVRFTSATAATATATDSPAIFGNNARVEFSITYNV